MRQAVTAKQHIIVSVWCGQPKHLLGICKQTSLICGPFICIAAHSNLWYTLLYVATCVSTCAVLHPSEEVCCASVWLPLMLHVGTHRHAHASPSTSACAWAGPVYVVRAQDLVLLAGHRSSRSATAQYQVVAGHNCCQFRFLQQSLESHAHLAHSNVCCCNDLVNAPSCGCRLQLATEC